MEDKSLNYIFHETLDKLLHLSHNPVQCVEYLTQQIHELVGAKSVIIAVHKETNSSEIFGLYPPLQKEWANQQAITELIDISFQNTKIQFWDKASQHILVVNNLKYLEIEKAICIPLVFAEKIIGSILMLGAKDVNNRDNIIKVISKLAGVLALIIGNEKQLQNITIELQNKNTILAESESKYRELVQNSPDAIAIYTAKELVFVNKECLQLMGATSENELLGRNVMDFVHPDSRRFVAERMKDALLNHKILPLAEEKFIRLDGTACDVDVKAIPITFEGKSAVQIIVRDITEQKISEALLKHERELYLDLVNAQPAGIYRLRVFSTEKWVEDAWSNSANSPYIVELASDRFCEILGVNRAEFENNPKVVSDLIHPDDKVEYEIRNKEANIKQIPFCWDCRLLIKGEVKWVHFESSPRKLENGDIIFTGILYDIGERKNAENALADSEEKFRSIYENSSVGKSMTSLDGVLKANKAYCEMLGYSLEELNTINWKNLTHEDDVDHDLEKVKLILSGAKEFDAWEKRYIHKDGHIVWVHITTTLQCDAAGNPLFFIAEFIDITERKIAEKKIQENYKLLGNLTAQIPGVVYQYRLYPDGSSAFPYSSEGMYEIYEVTPDEVREDASPVFTRLHPDDYDSIVETITVSARDETPYSSEFRVLLPGQGLRWRHCDAKPELLEDGSTLWHGVISDITDRKKAEETISKSKERLNRAELASKSGNWELLVETGIIKASKGACKVYGLERDEFNLKNIQKIPLDGYRPMMDLALKNLIEKGEPYNIEFKLKKADTGEIRDIHSSAVYDADRRVVFGVIQDVTEQKIAERALQESEDRFKILFEKAPDAMFLANTETKKIVDANEAASHLFKKEKNELIGLYNHELHPQKIASKSKEDFEILIQNQYTGIVLPIENTIITSEGIEIPVEILGQAIKIGEKELLLGTFRDISERKKAAEILKLRETYLTAIIENLPGIIWLKDAESHVLLSNTKFAHTFGCKKPEDLIGKTDLDFSPKEHAERYLADDRKVVTSKKPFHVEELIYDQKSIKWFETFKMPILNETNEVIGTAGYAQDISERKIAEKALKESEQKLSALFNGMSEMTVIHELVFDDKNQPVNYRIIDCNASFTKITGIDHGNAIDKLATEVYGTENPPYLDEYASVCLNDKNYYYQTYFPPMDKHFLISAVNLGQNRFATITADITDIQKVQDIIIEKNKELENYLYVASHDLRSPLVNIQGFSQRLQKHTSEIQQLLNTTTLQQIDKPTIEKIANFEIPKSIEFILTNIAKMDALINGLLQLSRTGKIVMTIHKIDMKSLYQKVLNGLNFELTELNANVAVEQIEDCYGDENQLYQVFTNLVGNAIKYRDKNRILSIEINSSVQFNKVIYCVKDNGIGINSRNINKIWDVFFRANPTDLEAGEGLGLSLARKIVEKHTGKIWVESELGVGSTFFVELSKTEFSEI